MSIWFARLKDFFHYKDLLKHLVMRDVKLKYRRSALGYLWSVLDPLLTMIVMTVVFSAMFQRNITNFPVYLFTGQLLFNFMKTSTAQAMNSINVNGALIKKAYVPKYIFTFSKVISTLIDLLFNMIALTLVMLVTRAPFSGYSLFFPFVLMQIADVLHMTPDEVLLGADKASQSELQEQLATSLKRLNPQQQEQEKIK